MAKYSAWKIIYLLVICALEIEGTEGSEGFYNIAHLCNNVEAVKWAVEQGANSVEMDLQFNDDGNPQEFSHGFPCDCTCKCSLSWGDNVCGQLKKTSRVPCNAGTAPKKLLNAAATQNLAMIMIDSKLRNLGESAQKHAAHKMINLIENELFGHGFKGEVIIVASKFFSLPYIAEISKTGSKHGKKIHFTIGGEKMLATKRRLDELSNKNVVHSIGTPHCIPLQAASKEMCQLAVLNKIKGVWGMSYVWTIDLPSSLSKYLNYFNGIITNHPGRLAKILKEKNVKLATPDDVIPPATSSNVITSNVGYESCDCDYASGGCQIVTPAPKGVACQCFKYFWYSCRGRVVFCSDSSSFYCSTSRSAIQACLLGRGNCRGY